MADSGLPEDLMQQGTWKVFPFVHRHNCGAPVGMLKDIVATSGAH
jgi:hypothetical protein